MFASIAAAVGLIVVTSLIVGLVLGLLGEKFKVEVDPREEQIRKCLSGSNCGACGYAGCDDYANAIVTRGASPSLCVAGDVRKIGEILGISLTARKREVAFVKCSGTCGKTNANYNYRDAQDCRIAYLAPGHGSKKCPFGCCGFGSCAAVCPKNAIRIIDGLAVVDDTKCIACGKCIDACPNHLIEIIPYDARYLVRCSSKSRGKDVRTACLDGCIGCGLCARQCASGAITIQNNLARINQDKCVACGKCAEKCPSKIIIRRQV